VASENSMFIFGGIDQQHERFNDILEFDFNTETWSNVVTEGTPPSPRTFHQALFYNGSIHIMGGFDGWKRNDMYKILIDNKDTSNPEEEEKDPNSEGVAKKEIFTPEYFQSMPLNKWQQITCNGEMYTPRTGHEVIAYEDKIYLFGGTDDDQRKNDLYAYDIYKN
jgi:N-acetylneuraminic acid mutarotase